MDSEESIYMNYEGGHEIYMLNSGAIFMIIILILLFVHIGTCSMYEESRESYMIDRDRR